MSLDDIISLLLIALFVVVPLIRGASRSRGGAPNQGGDAGDPDRSGRPAADGEDGDGRHRAPGRRSERRSEPDSERAATPRRTASAERSESRRDANDDAGDDDLQRMLERARRRVSEAMGEAPSAERRASTAGSGSGTGAGSGGGLADGDDLPSPFLGPEGSPSGDGGARRDPPPARLSEVSSAAAAADAARRGQARTRAEQRARSDGPARVQRRRPPSRDVAATLHPELRFDRDAIVRGFVWHQILSQPLAKRRRRVPRPPSPQRDGAPTQEDTIAPSVTLKLRSPAEALSLFGQNDENLKLLRSRLDAKLVARGDELRLSGDESAVREAEQTFRSLIDTIRRGGRVSLTELEHADLGSITPPKPRGESPQVHLPGRATPKTSGQRHYVQAIADNPITFGIGPAGTGKTYLAVAMAVQALTERRVKRIILTRPAVEAGEKLGFLPGDLAAKIDPYLRPLLDALYDMMPGERIDALTEQGVIEVAPLAFMRGRTLNDAFIILDEAQNTTSEQMKMFLTRMGFDSKVVITGDVTQTDLPGNVASGLSVAERLLSGIDGIDFVRFRASDVVRHPLVARIITAYETD